MSSAVAPRVGGRVIELVAARELVLSDRARPEPSPGEARVRILAVGVCGTDVHGYLGRADTLPITLGHDAVGVIDAFGVGTAHPLEIGQRVIIDPTVACGACVFCRADRPQLCVSGGYLGMTVPGAMADYIVVPATRLVPVPGELSDVDATVLEPVAVALHLLERIRPFAPAAQHAEVVGGGPLGVLLAQTLVARGWQVRVHEPQAYRRDIAESVGLITSDGSAQGPANPGPLLVVETSASAAGIELARRLANPGSSVALIGRAPADFSTAQILSDELSVVGVKSGFGHYPDAIALVLSGQVTPSATVTHAFDIAAADTAMRWVTDPARQVMRAVLHASISPTAKDTP
jgi:threonine dehydrogenase-like Zn-dependent dehydrogenase